MRCTPAIITLIIAMLTSFCAAAQPGFTPGGHVIEMSIPLRLRAAPNTRSDVLDLLPSGTALRIIARTEDNAWLEVETEHYSAGWVFADYVDVLIDLDTVRIQPAIPLPVDYQAVIMGINDNARRIFRRGQQMGLRADTFAKVGDSITVAPHMLHPLDDDLYQLDQFTHLQPAIEHFRPSGSFSRISLAAGIGWSAVTVLDPDYADSEACLAGESPLRCEYRHSRPAVALIMFGTNDVGIVNASAYRLYLGRVVEQSIDAGVLPILSTIPPRLNFEEKVAEFNQIVRETARRYEIPLWDYGRVMAAAGETALDEDGVHPSVPPGGYEGAADFRPSNLYYGYVLRNLTALYVLDALLHEVIAPPTAHAPG
jgi:hypothetical protein